LDLGWDVDVVREAPAWLFPVVLAGFFAGLGDLSLPLTELLST
jgi:hypothetical protein